MKKFFFVALLAISTVGVATLSKAGHIYEGDDNKLYNCDAQTSQLCTASDFPAGVQIREEGSGAPFEAPSLVLDDTDFKVQ